MAKRIQWCGKKLIEADGGIGWERQESGKYQAELFGVTYELEKRRRSKAERGDPGWYLYSSGAPDGNFSGDYTSSTLMEAVEEATTMLLKLDLRGPGYEPVR
ncbi:hypothetical protein ADL22_12660 [Streptomyces sp. NRRL F-4489]|uniref:hypothetical protein n=1 Tax=Streptomyces sp. NRRL F-4489 TaxID=1609095 RepID=UPI000747DCD8|nr:hypothetical protein [Streptomyces sp. NRRL F-4489]KUL44788.1 hypothetical protein ADL22_12660 [Streptomyces sp. NRRL F-4489]